MEQETENKTAHKCKTGQKPKCVFPHDGETSSTLGIKSLSSSSSTDLLQLLGESEESLKQLMSAGHPYVFNLGGDRVLPSSDCNAVADLLLARNLPCVFNDTPTTTTFIPETFLPTIPLAVGTEAELKEKLSSLSTEEKKRLGLDGCLKDQVAGDRLEQCVFNALRKYPECLGVVIQGGCMRTPGAKSRGEHSEHDFLIINPKLMYLLVIECKRSLTGKAINDCRKGCVTQLSRVKARLETYFGKEISSCWRFIGMVFYNEDLKPDRIICKKCEPFTVHGEEKVSQKISDLGELLNQEHRVLKPSLAEYKKIVATLLFLISARPSPAPCLLQTEVFKKIVGEKGRAGKKDKIGQGSLSSIIFWTNSQTEIMFNPNLLFVVFLGSWSVGKTLCMREKARQLASEDLAAPSTSAPQYLRRWKVAHSYTCQQKSSCLTCPISGCCQFPTAGTVL